MRRASPPLLALLFTTTTGLCAFLAVLWSVDPSSAGFLELAVFYASLFVALGGVAAFGIMYFRSQRFRKDPSVFFAPSLRRGLLVASVLTSLLMLQDARVLGPLTVLPLLVAAAYVEFRAVFGGGWFSKVWHRIR